MFGRKLLVIRTGAGFVVTARHQRSIVRSDGWRRYGTEFDLAILPPAFGHCIKGKKLEWSGIAGKESGYC